MGIESLQGSMDAQANLAKTLLSGPMQEQEMAMKVAGTEMQMQLQAQQSATAQAAVADMTGIGGKLNTFA